MSGKYHFSFTIFSECFVNLCNEINSWWYFNRAALGSKRFWHKGVKFDKKDKKYKVSIFKARIRKTDTSLHYLQLLQRVQVYKEEGGKLKKYIYL